jgi:DNA-binding protein HU-beta
MTKSQLQAALAEATQTDKKTAGAFLNALGPIAYKVVKKEGEFVLPGFGKLVRQKRAARTGFNVQTRQKVKVAAKTVVRGSGSPKGPRTRSSGPRRRRRRARKPQAPAARTGGKAGPSRKAAGKGTT